MQLSLYAKNVLFFGIIIAENTDNLFNTGLEERTFNIFFILNLLGVVVFIHFLAGVLLLSNEIGEDQWS